MRSVLLGVWLLVFVTFNVLLGMAMAPGTPWLFTACNVAIIALLTLWYFGYFTRIARRYRTLVLGGTLFVWLVALDMLVHGMQAWRDNTCDGFFSHHRLGLFQEVVRLTQAQGNCRGLGVICSLMALLMLSTSCYLGWVQFCRHRLKPWCN